jgi:hypothetical protein
MAYTKEQQEFVQFVDFYNTTLADPNIKDYVPKYSDFCSYRIGIAAGNETLEQSFISFI